MARPSKKRKICLELKAAYFKPQGISGKDLSEVLLEVDEMEAVRLADLKGEYQENAAWQMGISRPTFSNIINRAHAKIAEALVGGKALRINCPRFAGKEILIVFCLFWAAASFADDPGAAAVPLSFGEFSRKVEAYYPRLKGAQGDIAAALARKMQAQAGFWPTLGVSAGYTVSNDPGNVFGMLLRQDRFTSSDFDLKRLNSPDRHQGFAGGIHMEIPLFDAMQSIRRTRAAGDGVMAAQADAAFTRMEALLIAHDAYLNALALERLSTLITEVEAGSAADFRKAKDLKDKGVVQGADYYSARVMLGDVRRMKNEVLRQHTAMMALLNILMGEPVEKYWIIVGSIKDTDFPTQNRKALIEAALLNRQDVTALDARLRAADHEAAREKASGLPSVNAFGDAANERNTLVSPGGNQYSVGVKAQMPLFDPSRKGRVAEISARKEQLRNGVDALKDRVRQDISEEVSRYEALRDNMSVYKEMSADAGQAVALTLPLYDEGRRSIADLLELRRAYLQSAQAYDRALTGIWLSRARLLFLTGRLNNDEIKRLAEGAGL
jgi:outer membrane protein TolC/predicted DNA-binding protein (UPF0251 family)